MLKNYFLKTKYNENKTEEIQSAISAIGVSIDESFGYFSSYPNELKDISVSSVPCLIAVYDDGTQKTLIHQESSPFKIGSFQADADAKLDEHLNGQ